MKPRVVPVQERLRALRAEFDQTFSLPRRPEGREREGFLKIRVAGDAYALRLNHVDGLASRPRIVPLPSRCPEFLGMAGHRGGLAALFSLPRLLGYAGTETPSRWFVLLRASGSLGLAFETYEGFAWMDTAEIRGIGDAVRRRHVLQAVQHEGLTRLIVDVPGVLGALTPAKGEN